MAASTKPATNCTRWSLLLSASVLCLCSNVFEQSGYAQDEIRHSPKQHALSEIFQDTHISQNVFDVRRQLVGLSAEDRFQRLSDWVLPGRNHSGIRLGGAFTPTNPAPVADVAEAESIPEFRNSISRGNARVQIGGNLVSPVCDLIDVVKELNRRISERSDCFITPIRRKLVCGTSSGKAIGRSSFRRCRSRNFMFPIIVPAA